LSSKKSNKKTIKIIIILALFLTLAGIFIILTFEEKHKTYDVVIVGGGLSGLSAAYELGDYDTIIIEKEDYPGGRVLTKSQQGINYDMGAIFGYIPQVIPFKFESSTFYIEQEPVAIYYNSEIYYGSSPSECINNMDLQQKDLTEILDFKEGKITSSELSESNYTILNSFFRVIHSGDLNEYIPIRQKDCFYYWNSGYYEKGNNELVEEYLNRIQAKIQLSSEVISVKEDDNSVKTTYLNGEEP